MTQDHRLLRLRIKDLDDVSVLSSMVQDSLMALCDATYLAVDKSFVVILNRFCWEDVDDTNDGGQYNRTHTALRFDNVKAVQMRNIDSKKQDAIHNLLAVAYDDRSKTLALHFAGGGAIRLSLSKLNGIIEDMGDVWPSYNKPGHVVGT